MNTISIGRRLWFEETLLGATLNFQTSEGPEAVLFRVGISFRSLMECDKAMAKPVCLWTIRDESLRVYGDYEELSLSFRSVNGSDIEADIRLHGEELRLFRYAINALAFSRQAILN